MKNFFTSFLGSCLGIFAAIVIGFLILLGIGLSGLVKKDSLSDNTILKINLNESMPELSGNIQMESPILNDIPDGLGLNTVRKLLASAAEDEKIRGIVIETNEVGLGQAGTLSLRSELEKFKESGKFVYAYSDFYGQSAYFLSTVSDSIFLNPNGMVDLRGFGTMIPYMKDMLDKIGVSMNVFYAGNFKSATEPFRLSEMSEYNKIQTRAFLTDMKDILVQKIADTRHISAEQVETAISNFSGKTPQHALESKLIDGILYKDEFEKILKIKLGIDEDKKLKYIDLAAYRTHVKEPSESAKEKIAILYAEGEIAYNSSKSGEINEKKYLKALEKIKNDKKVKALVLRVNSPGGSSFTSDLIWHEIENIKAAGKPVVASFGDYAASGGYYISAGADYIVSQPNTLTGSIGVFMMFPDASTLMNDKIGINFDTLKTHPFAAAFSPFNKLTDAEKEVLQASTLEIYDTFVKKVSDGRKLSIDSTKTIAQGRVWTGRMAKEIGLVDELGDIDTAISKAAALANMDNYRIVEYPSIEDDFMTKILKEVKKAEDPDATSKLSAEEKKILKYFNDVKALLKVNEPVARLPYIFVEN